MQRVTPTPQATGGHATYSGSITTTVTTVKSSAGQVFGWQVNNPNAAPVYVQFFDASAPTLGTTAPIYSLGVPASSSVHGSLPAGIAHATAIKVAVTTTRTGSIAPGSSVDLNIFYT